MGVGSIARGDAPILHLFGENCRTLIEVERKGESLTRRSFVQEWKKKSATAKYSLLAEKGKREVLPSMKNSLLRGAPPLRKGRKEAPPMRKGRIGGTSSRPKSPQKRK